MGIMKQLYVFAFLGLSCAAFAQEDIQLDSDALLSELSDNACACIDEISTYNKHREEVVKEINTCIEEVTQAYQLGTQLFKFSKPEKSEKITEQDSTNREKVINTNKESKQYKDAYYKIEEQLMESCEALKQKVAASDKQGLKSMSLNEQALKYYREGVAASEKGDFSTAVKQFKKALKEDEEFAFAWDNLGLAYRKQEKYDKAIEAYEKSIEIDPYGLMPLQNIAIAYQYQEEYDKAIDAYKRLALIDEGNPEVAYGIGSIYALKLNEYEKALDYMCKAFNAYTKMKSPYRSDAEQIINIIYQEMKKEGKEETFKAILKDNGIDMG
ncbi:hypothetical protein CJ305_09900 [Leeuwenhoekiella nanhaiensis]|uniref:Uncharacterized protein n=2 Tax=Leeuwenhoekiella nanhaiensis TaxID=1655491 RepID=A0A2G1VS85_9FLAO|nr:hypothetical protein CJ305_09900 [Leeuwenhoekiella nanhaiensis]